MPYSRKEAQFNRIRIRKRHIEFGLQINGACPLRVIKGFHTNRVVPLAVIEAVPGVFPLFMTANADPYQLNPEKRACGFIMGIVARHAVNLGARLIRKA
jgi:hypothetical protein